MNKANRFAVYENKTNAIIIFKTLKDEDIGYYKIEVITEETVNNKTYKYQKSLYLRIFR